MDIDPEVNQLLSDKLNDRLTEIQEKYKEPPILKKNPRFRGNRGDLEEIEIEEIEVMGEVGKVKGENGKEKGQGGSNSKYRKNKLKKDITNQIKSKELSKHNKIFINLRGFL